MVGALGFEPIYQHRGYGRGREVCTGAMEEERKNSLDFCITLGGPAAEPEKIEYLMRGSNLDFLRKWSPDDSRLVLQVLKTIPAKSEQYAWTDFEKAVELVVPCIGATDKKTATSEV